ncbi:DUF4115 domain-containing protein [Carnobacteriaceae bacterium zg-ZUI240]|nr:DUF4115 domain-containing protein [Carnobacteriaceae bacterium zg-ZUI240]
MSVFGEQLREKREKLGYSIEDISHITTIQSRFIVALEEENFDTIPGDYYVRSFVKQYATILKLDANKLIKQYEQIKQVSEQKRPEVLLQEELRKPARQDDGNLDKPSKNDIDETESTHQDVAQDEVVQENIPQESDSSEVVVNEDDGQNHEAVENVEETVNNETFDTLENDEAVFLTPEMDNADEQIDGDQETTPHIHTVPFELDSDGLDETDFSFENFAQESVDVDEETVEAYEAVESAAQENKLSKKMIGLLMVLALLIVALVWAIPQVMQAVAPKQTMTQTSQSTLVTTSQTETTTTTTQTTTAQTTAETTAQTTAPQAAEAPQQEAPRPSDEPADLYIMSSDAFQTTYGLGASYAHYTGEYVVTLTASEPVWISVEIFGQKVHEGTMTPGVPYRLNAYNNAGYMKIRVGLSSALTVTFNGQKVDVPTYNRVQDYTFNFER